MINEDDLSISELMNYGMNYGTCVPININELEKLFDKKEARKEFRKYIDVIKKDLIEKYKIPDTIITAYIENGRIFSFEHDSIKKEFYFDYYTLMQISCAYFLNEKESEEIADRILSYPVDQVKTEINKKLKELRTKMNQITSREEFESFMNQHLNFYHGTMSKIYHGKKILSSDVIEYMSQTITNVIVNNKYLVDSFQKKCVNSTILNGINKEKFLFYLAASTLQKCFQFKEIDPAIYYTINYYLQKEEENPKIQITVGQNSYSFLTFSKQLQAYLKLHPNISMKKFKKNTFKGCSPEEVKEYLLEFQNDTMQSFEVVDTNDVYIPNGEKTDRKNEKSTTTKRKNKSNEEVSLLALQKRRFYHINQEQIYMTLMGKNKFHGYLAHVLKNGYVIFEKHNKGTNMISNQSGAAYIMTIYNFNEFSKKTIPELRDYVKKCPNGDINYLCHSGAWINRLQKVVDQSTGIALPEIERVFMKYKTNK